MVIYQKLLPRTKKRGVFYLSLKISSLNRLASYDEYPPDEYPQIQFLSKHQRPIQNSNPTLYECSLLRAFVAPPITATPAPNHLLHLLPITCFRDRQNRHANIMGAGPRPTR